VAAARACQRATQELEIEPLVLCANPVVVARAHASTAAAAARDVD